MVKQQDQSFNVLQHADQATSQKTLETISGIVPDQRARPRLQVPAFHQSQNLTLADQLKLRNHAQAMLLGPVQESTSEVQMTNSCDWVNQAYNKIQHMKEVYLSEILTLCAKTQEMMRGATDVGTKNKCEKTRYSVENIIRFLNVSRSDLLHWSKEKLCLKMSDVMKLLHQIRVGNFLHMKQTQQVEASGNNLEAPPIQQREKYIQPASLHQYLGQRGALSLPQSSLNPFKVGLSAGVHKVDASSMVNASHYNPMISAQQWALQGSMVPSPPKGPQTVFDQRARRMLLHPSSGVSQQNNLSTQQTVNPSRNILNLLDYSVSSMAQTPVSMSSLQNNQQDPAMKRQKMRQPVQQLMPEKNKQRMLQKRNEKLRRFVGFSQKSSPVLPPSSSPYIISPQDSQQFSSQLELEDLSSKCLKSAIPSLSASPSALRSPFTPLTPSCKPADSVKSPLFQESSKLAKTSAAPVQLPLKDKNQSQNQVVTDTQRLTKSCLSRESTCLHDEQSSHAEGDPQKRLVEVVKLISSRALNATLRDINAVTNLTNRIAEHFLHGDPKRVIFQDLADDVSNGDYGTSSRENRTGMKSRMKHERNTMAWNDTTTEMEFCGSVRMKRLKIEPNNLMLQEIKEINKKLIEVVVDVMTVEEVSRTGFDEGTLIRCSYVPVGLLRNIQIESALKLMFPNLLLELIVPADYPNSSPTVLETMPSGFSDAEDGKYLWMKTKSYFTKSLRKFSQPISIKEMAETWDICAREVFHKFAEQMGGGNLSSTYGRWEHCAVAL